MRERATGYHPEGAQVQQSLDTAIAGFYGGTMNPNTKAAYEGDSRAFSNFATVNNVSQLNQLTSEFIDSYLEHCETSGLSRETIRRRSASLSSFLAKAGMEEFAKIARNISIKYIGTTREVHPFHPLSKEDIKRLQGVSRNNPRASAIIAIALGTGANITEILALHANSIHEADGQVSVRFGGKHGRTVKLSPDASVTVRKHKADRRRKLPLFTIEQLDKRETKPLTRQGLWSVLKEYGERIGIPDLKLRDLRETFIMDVKTNDPKKLAELLGVNESQAYVLLKRRRLTQQLPQGGVLFEAATK